jgi:hypothetical protein
MEVGHSNFFAACPSFLLALNCCIGATTAVAPSRRMGFEERAPPTPLSAEWSSRQTMQRRAIWQTSRKTIRCRAAIRPRREIAGKAGGTDAAAGAQMAGAGNQGGAGLRQQNPDATGSPGSPGGNLQGDQINPGAGAAVAGGTGLGEAASAGDTRTGTSSGQAGSVTGGNPSSGDIPPPTDKGGASAA